MAKKSQTPAAAAPAKEAAKEEPKEAAKAAPAKEATKGKATETAPAPAPAPAPATKVKAAKGQAPADGEKKEVAVAAKSADKKKKKNKPKNLDVSKYATLVAGVNWPITVQASQNKGRHAVAAKDLEPGTVICNERAATLIVSSAAQNDFCHRCVSSLVTAEQSKNRTSCGACAKTTYCSSACQKADAARHKIECPIIPKLAEIATKHDINVDLLKLTLSLLVRRALEERREKLSDENKELFDAEVDAQEAPVAPWWAIQELTVHPEVFDKKWIKCVTAAAKDMSLILPEQLAATPEEIVLLSCRINTNAHSLTDEDEKASDTAFGLFPMGALFFKHSCAPNCHFTADKGVLTYRVVKPVKAGEELLVSHIELYQPRSVRKQELRTTKRITCDCSRCRAPLRKSSDRWLDGILCDKCHKGVYLDASEYPEIFTKERLATDAAAFKAAEDAAPPKEEPKLTEIDADGNEVEKKVTPEEKYAAEQEEKIRSQLSKMHVRCDECGAEAIKLEVELVRARAQQNYQMVVRTLESRNDATIVENFRAYIDHYNNILHPYNYHLINAHLPLLNSLKSQKQYAECLPLIKHLIDVYETSKVVPPLRHEFVELYQELGSVLASMGSQSEKAAKDKLAANNPAAQAAAQAAEEEAKKNKDKKGGKDAKDKKKKEKKVYTGGALVANRHKKESMDAYRKAYAVAKVVLGEQNTRTLDIKKHAKI
ncbi:hypothetical protein HKX48_007121 [Thoreauomyces humboldtii]|nr:hypothetical protein HKX48_007121 [Thoreauomyces humboldtii]